MTTAQWALEKIQKTKEKASTILNLSKRSDETFDRLTEIPNEVFELSWLTTLDLSHNLFTSLSDSISKLQNLTRLFLDNNQLANMPERAFLKSTGG